MRARANAETLRDTHCICGDPYTYDIYGQASFDCRGIQNHQPKIGIVWLRNPSEKTITYTLPFLK